MQHSKNLNNSSLTTKINRMFEPKLPPINLWSVAPAWVFYMKREQRAIHEDTTGNHTTNINTLLQHRSQG